MLVRSRKSRIYFLRRFFDYPIRLTLDTLAKLGFVRTIRIGFSYVYSVLFPESPRATGAVLHQPLRFGAVQDFFRTTPRSLGVPCHDSAPSGSQRVKGLSIASRSSTFSASLSQAFRHRAEETRHR